MNAEDEIAGHGMTPDEAPDEAPELAAVPGPGPRSGTGDARVDRALRELDDLRDLEVAEHPAVFERVHAGLAEVLSELRTGRDG